MAERPTLVSLARDLGVSRQTISNALNAPQRVNAVTLERVLKGIEESGYRPHVAGRQLRTRSSHNLAMRLYPSTDGINGSVLDRFLHALTEAAQRRSYRLTLFTAADDAGEIDAIDDLLGTADIDGFVLTSTHHDDARTAWLLEHDVPFVAFGRPWSSAPHEAAHSWVDVDGGAGTAEAAALLLAKGHRHVGFLGWPGGSGVGDDRRDGWRRTLAAAGLDDVAARLHAEVEDSVPQGARGARELFERGATALVCASDSLALGAVTAWRELEPHAVAGPPVIGFDDTPVVSALGLSSVRQPIEQVAQHVVDLLLRQLPNRPDPDRTARHELIPASLVEREPDPHLFEPTD
ncbi:LacI family DNA-binding transcriptional regulator [Nocardioides mesophilus]|uniref:Substrate-binding domain-containing protein n=1 Tax=Nocardioides mesophilus TaxID=433659 RepID=A0A7G9R9Q4_9ACTN|nr:substrate-binding domain-containing protein [Nocardioides mesophilus]QNN52329.1 substrate-binding domain-containing protein [Nocardioides mesophilus]